MGAVRPSVCTRVRVWLVLVVLCVAVPVGVVCMCVCVCVFVCVCVCVLLFCHIFAQNTGQLGCFRGYCVCMVIAADMSERSVSQLRYCLCVFEGLPISSCVCPGSRLCCR